MSVCDLNGLRSTVLLVDDLQNEHTEVKETEPVSGVAGVALSMLKSMTKNERAGYCSKMFVKYM